MDFGGEGQLAPSKASRLPRVTRIKVFNLWIEAFRRIIRSSLIRLTNPIMPSSRIERNSKSFKGLYRK